MSWFYYRRTTYFKPKKSSNSDVFWGFAIIIGSVIGAVNGGFGGAALGFLGVAFIAYLATGGE